MKKKLLYLSSLAVLSVSMVSCIDNDEPAGIKALREAKVNEINAIALKDSAEAVKTLAEAAKINAEVVAQELVNAYNEVVNANKIKVDNAKTDLEVEKAKNNLEKAKLNAQLTIDNLKAQIEAGKYSNAQLILAAEGLYYGDVVDALSDVKDAEDEFAGAVKSLATAQQDLLVAINTASKDSLDARFELEKAVSSKKHAYDMAGKNIVYAEKDLADFQAIDKNDHKVWGQLYNRFGDTIKAIDAQLNAIAKEGFELEEDMAEAEAQYLYQESLLDSASSIYGDQERYIQFTIPAAIADECKNWEFADSEGDLIFSVNESGVLANEVPIENSDLSDILDDVLTEIESHIYTSSDSNTISHQLKELEAQKDAYKTKYESDLTDFNTSVKAYKDAAIAYQWSDVNENSTLYEDMKAAIESYVSDASKDDAKRKALAGKFQSFYKARKAFDGYESSAYNGTFNAKEMLTSGTNLTEEQLSLFDDLMSYSLIESLIGYSSDKSESLDGAYGKYVSAAGKLFGNALGTDKNRFEILSEEELDELYDDDPSDLFANYGSQGKYACALRNEVAFGKDINNIDAWKSFYNDVKSVKDANDAKLKTLADNEHISFITLEKEKVFTAYREMYNKYLQLEAKGNALSDRKTYMESLQSGILSLTSFLDEEGNPDPDAIESYEKAVEYLELAFARVVEEARETEKEAKIAYEKAEKDLADFDAGEYDTVTTILDAQEKVEKEQYAYNKAKESLDIMKAYYEDFLASLK